MRAWGGLVSGHGRCGYLPDLERQATPGAHAHGLSPATRIAVKPRSVLELVFDGLQRADAHRTRGRPRFLLDHLAGEGIADELASRYRRFLHEREFHQTQVVEGPVLLDGLDHDIG